MPVADISKLTLNLQIIPGLWERGMDIIFLYNPIISKAVIVFLCSYNQVV